MKVPLGSSNINNNGIFNEESCKLNIGKPDKKM